LLPTQNRDALDPALLHEMHDRIERRILGHGHRIGRHHIQDLAAMRVDIFVRELIRSHQEFNPAAPPRLGVRLDATQAIALGDDTDKVSFAVDDRQAADPVLEHQPRHIRDRGFGSDEHDLPSHYISGIHRILRFVFII
jgi:hypothetical protein